MTDSGMTRSVIFSPFIYRHLVFPIGFALPFSNSILHKCSMLENDAILSPLQPEKADSPIVVTELGIIT